MPDGLRQRYADALAATCKRHEIESGCISCDRRIAAVLAVRDDELERLRVVEVASIGAHALLADAEAAIDRVRRLCDLTIDTSIRLGAIDQARDTLVALAAEGARDA